MAQKQVIQSLREQPSYLVARYNQLKGNRQGGVYVPPHRLKELPSAPEDQQNLQRVTWQLLKKSINGIVNKVNISNIQHIVYQLFNENLMRGKGLLAKALVKAQLSAPIFTNVYAALISVLNTKLPEVGLLVATRVVLQFQRSYKRNNKSGCISTAKFLAHLVNQLVVEESLALQLLIVLLQQSTNDSVELACSFTCEVGESLTQLCPSGADLVFDRFKELLHQGEVGLNAQYAIQNLFVARRNGFRDYPGVLPQLNLVQPEQQNKHVIDLLRNDLNGQQALNYYRHDPQFKEHQQAWERAKLEILGKEHLVALNEPQLFEESEEEIQEEQVVAPLSQKQLVQLRRTIYLTIQSSHDQQECCHKIIKMGIGKGHEFELADMIIQCCIMERIYQRFYSLLVQNFCQLQQLHKDCYSRHFLLRFQSLHRQQTARIRNLAKLFGHLFVCGAIEWQLLTAISLTQEDTTPSSRIFIKILLKEVAQFIGFEPFKKIIKQEPAAFSGILRKDSSTNIRFAINFLTQIGLGPLTDDLRIFYDQLSNQHFQQPVHQAVQKLNQPLALEGDQQSDSEVYRARRNKCRERQQISVQNQKQLQKIVNIQPNIQIKQTVLEKQPQKEKEIKSKSKSVQSQRVRDIQKDKSKKVQESRSGSKCRAVGKSPISQSKERSRSRRKSKQKKNTQQTKGRFRRFSDSEDSMQNRRQQIIERYEMRREAKKEGKRERREGKRTKKRHRRASREKSSSSSSVISQG